MGDVNDHVCNAAILPGLLTLSYDVPGKYDYRHRYAQWILEYTNGNNWAKKKYRR